MYFDIHIHPRADASSGIILIDNFDPRWKEAIPRIMNTGVRGRIEEYASVISQWSGVDLQLVFDPIDGLKHVNTQPRAALDLTGVGVRSFYCSHNIHSFPEVGAVVSLMSHYIYWMNCALNDSKS